MGKREILEAKKVRILEDEKQKRVTIPVTFADKLKINAKRDNFIWILEEENGEISLRGNLIKNA